MSQEKVVTVRHRATGLEWKENPEQAKTRSLLEFEVSEEVAEEKKPVEEKPTSVEPTSKPIAKTEK